MPKSMLDSPDLEGLGPVLKVLTAMNGGQMPANEVAKFLRGEPTEEMGNWKKDSNQHNPFGIALDLMTKAKGGAIPLDEIAKFANGEPTDGKRFWTVGKPTRTVLVPKTSLFQTATMFTRKKVGTNLRVGRVGHAFMEGIFPEVIHNVPIGRVAIRPVRRETSAEDVFEGIGSANRGLVTVPEFHAALADKDKRRGEPKSSLMGFAVGDGGGIWMLYANWLIMGGFGQGPDEVATLLLAEQKNQPLNFMVGIEVVVRA